MEKISDMIVEPCIESPYLTPLRLSYEQNGYVKAWDLLCAHGGVSIIIFNVSRNKLVLVKQFRPPIFYADFPASAKPKIGDRISVAAHDVTKGFTIELCAGIIDKNKSLPEIAAEEVMEECGYKVDPKNLQQVSCYRAGVSIHGSKHYLYYVEVTDDMKVSEGGGNAHEGEFLEVIEMTIHEARDYINGKGSKHAKIPENEMNSPADTALGLMWFLNNKAATFL